MEGCHLVSMPLPPHAQFQPTSAKEHASVSSYPYLKVIGSLTYAAMGTRPDICTTIRSLSPFATTFGPEHIHGVNHIMRYLSACPNHHIMYTISRPQLM